MDYSRYFWQGERVRLRPLRADDAEQSFQYLFDSPSRQMLQLGVELPTSLEAQREKLARFADCRDVDGVIIFAVENLEGECVGGVSSHTRDMKNGTFSFGINIYAPYRRRGYAEDAVRILLKYFFWEQRYQMCNSACLEGNDASYHLHRKLGFAEEGRRRRQVFCNGRYYDEILFGLTRDEFDAIMQARGVGNHSHAGGEA